MKLSHGCVNSEKVKAGMKQISHVLAGLMVMLMSPMLLASPNGHHENVDEPHHSGWHSKGKHHGEGHGWGGQHMSVADRLEKMKKHLDLNDQQVAQLKDLFETHDMQVKPLREQKRENRQMIRAMVEKGVIDDAELERLANAQGELKAKMIMFKVKHRVAMANILTADQREKFKKYWKGKDGHHGDKKWRD